MTGFRWRHGPGRGSTGRFLPWPDGAAAANGILAAHDPPAGGSSGGACAGTSPLDDILAPFLPGAAAEVIILAVYRSGRR